MKRNNSNYNRKKYNNYILLVEVMLLITKIVIQTMKKNLLKINLRIVIKKFFSNLIMVSIENKGP